MNFKLPSEARLIYQASVAIFPLCLAVIPWGVLCGSLAIQAGLSPLQAQAMSLFVFAGAAQLAGISLFGVMSPTLPILSSNFCYRLSSSSLFSRFSNTYLEAILV